MNTPEQNGGPVNVTTSDEGIITGNTYDKYGSSNPVVRRLMTNFEGNLDELFKKSDPKSLLDVGCGEGVLIHEWAKHLSDKRVVGIDLEEESIQAGWAQRQAPNLEYIIMRAENLPFATMSLMLQLPSRYLNMFRILNTQFQRWQGSLNASCSCLFPANRFGALLMLPAALM